jgi:DNA-binding transcriptional ArsR family regulator
VPSPSDVLFRALGDPTRRAIFERLAKDGEQSVHALTDQSGVSQPMVSKHLAALKIAGLVRERRAGRETYYGARPPALAPLIDWMVQNAALSRDRFDRTETPRARDDS